MRSVEWHPMVVHFPLALVVTAALLLSAARLIRDERRAALLAGAGTVDLCLGALGALVAFATGLAAILGLTLSPAARLAVATHVKWAVLTSAVLLLLAVWRAVGQVFDSRPSRLFLVLLWLMTAALTMTGYRGGVNVYRYGIGVDSALGQDPPARD
jgi:uncharacterized membrane protein